MDLTNCLLATGLTSYEAKVYLALLSEGALSGYEAAKFSGISRSNVYIALEGLIEKGAAYKIDGESVKYTAVPADEYCKNKERWFAEVLTFIKENAPKKLEPPDAYITVTGDVRIINKMKNLIEDAKERLYVSMSAKECEIIKNELISAVRRGIKVVIITSEQFYIDGAEIFHAVKEAHQIRIIADSSFVLTCNMSNEKSAATCLFTQNKTLITLFKEALRNEINLIKIKQKEGINDVH